MALIAIGDIHGCPQSLDALLARLDPSPDDHLLFVGDYIDRGPDSKAVIDRLLALREDIPCTFLRGNHEAMMIEYLDTGAFSLWRMNGGVSTLQSYLGTGSEIDIPESHVEFVRDTKLYHETDDYFFVHAGLKPTRTIRESLEDPDEEVLLWERGHLNVSEVAWEKTVVCGHTPRAEPINREKLILIDTGCVYHDVKPGMGRLTAVYLPEREFVDVAYADG